MDVQTGIVCGACDRLNRYDRNTCEECGNDLSSLGINRNVDEPSGELLEESKGPEPGAAPAKPPTAAQQEAEEKPMEQSRHVICKSCYSPVPAGHKFCGKCGAPGDGAAGEEPEYFGDMQVPGKAKLILIKGEGMDGISYHLNSTEHLAGRTDGAILFTEDKWLSPKHANFFYADDTLKVRDESSVNGIYLCVRGPVDVASGATFMAGGQVFSVETVSEFNDEPEDDGTYFFASPRREPVFKVVQVLEGSGEGIVVHSKDNQVTLGREACDINFPHDPYISGSHLKVEFVEGRLRLVDLGSKNGTYLKIEGEADLSHGDYLFLGRQLLRVEITN